MQKRLINLYRLILSDKNTRNLFFFLLVNLVFAFVELFYGLLTNSLGLISDSFHMFFDCSALLLGLAASLVTKWKPSDKFTYGFGRAEVLAGLANGLFLLFIALFIMKEAIERTFEPPEVHHERLFVISVLGFIVNLIGIFVFQHGGQTHHHGSGGCSHTHSGPSTNSKTKQHSHQVEYTYDNRHGYSHYSNPVVLNDHSHHKDSVGSISLDMNGYSSAIPQSSPFTATEPTDPSYAFTEGDQQFNSTDAMLIDPNHNHDHHHHDHHEHHEHKHHRGQIMQSVFLHIVADTLGSVGVMISALLMNQFGWMIADPLCSLFIAVLISISVYPLLRDSFYILMQRTPVELEAKLPDCLFKLQNLEGVLSVQETHFWTLYGDKYVGCLKLEVTQSANHKLILEHTKRVLRQIGVDKVHIQIDHVQ
jgi:zinc transporter 5/7